MFHACCETTKGTFLTCELCVVAMETCELRVLGGVLWTMVFSESDKPSFYLATPTQSQRWRR